MQYPAMQLIRSHAVAFAVALCAVSASSCRTTIPSKPPPLANWDEPAEWLRPPDDEARRKELPPGSFSGIRVRTTRTNLDEEPVAGLEVAAVVENSPAAAAGIAAGDLLLRARSGALSKDLDAPSDWRGLELDLPPGSELELLGERAGKPVRTKLVLAERWTPSEREEPARFREDERVGFVVRAATEVEARAAGLAPGAGVVLTGLAAGSPWRGLEDGPRYGDLLVSVDGATIDDAARLLSAVRAAKDGQSLLVEFVHEGRKTAAKLPTTRRAGEVKLVSIPLVLRYEKQGDRASWSAILGLVAFERTRAAWKLTLLWLLDFAGGDADRLEGAQ